MSRDGVRDWTYRDAQRRLLRAARARLPEHVGKASLDDYGNRVVRCGCGWQGNGIGWAGHVDSVVRSAVDADTPQ